MPAPPLANNADGGVNGATVSTADTGSGDAWNSVVIAAGTGLLYSPATPRGPLSIGIPQPASGLPTYTLWTGLGSLTGSVYFRMYCYFHALPSANTWVFRAESAAAARSANIRVQTNGFVQASNAAGTAIVASLGTVAIAVGRWIRIEVRVLSSTTVGEVEWRLYNEADSTVITETKAVTAQVLAANTGQVRWGTAETSIYGNQTAFFDDFGVSSVDWLGPIGQAYPSDIPSWRRRPVPMMQGPDVDQVMRMQI